MANGGVVVDNLASYMTTLGDLDLLEVQLDAIHAQSIISLALSPERIAQELFAALDKYCIPVKVQATKSPEVYSNTDSLATKYTLMKFACGSVAAAKYTLPLLEKLPMFKDTLIRHANNSSLLDVCRAMKIKGVHCGNGGAMTILTQLAEADCSNSRAPVSVLYAVPRGDFTSDPSQLSQLNDKDRAYYSVMCNVMLNRQCSDASAEPAQPPPASVKEDRPELKSPQVQQLYAGHTLSPIMASWQNKSELSVSRQSGKSLVTYVEISADIEDDDDLDDVDDAGYEEEESVEVDDADEDAFEVMDRKHTHVSRASASETSDFQIQHFEVVESKADEVDARHVKRQSSQNEAESLDFNEWRTTASTWRPTRWWPRWGSSTRSWCRTASRMAASRMSQDVDFESGEAAEHQGRRQDFVHRAEHGGGGDTCEAAAVFEEPVLYAVLISILSTGMELFDALSLLYALVFVYLTTRTCASLFFQRVVNILVLLARSQGRANDSPGGARATVGGLMFSKGSGPSYALCPWCVVRTSATVSGVRDVGGQVHVLSVEDPVLETLFLEIRFQDRILYGKYMNLSNYVPRT